MSSLGTMLWLLVTEFPKTFGVPNREIKYIPMSTAVDEAGDVESLFFVVVVMAPTQIPTTMNNGIWFLLLFCKRRSIFKDEQQCDNCKLLSCVIS